MFLVIVKIIICILSQCNSDNEETQTFLGDSCRISSTGIKGTCRLLQECPSAKENLSTDIRRQICGFEGNNPLVCCIDDVPSTTEILISNETSTRKLLPVLSRQDTQRLSLQKCLEYRNRVYSDVHCSHFHESIEDYGIAPAEKYPYFALVGYLFLNEVTWGCHGELLSELYVLTLDSCLYSFAYGNAKFVRLGGNLSIPSDYDKKQVQVINVEELIKYPRDLSPGINHKIALLKLGKPAVLNRFVVPICLPTSENVQSVITATDWKYYFREDAQDDTHLREVTVEEVPSEECKKTYRDEVQLIHVCAKLRKRTEIDQCAAKGGLIEPHSQIQCMYSLIGFEVSSKACGAEILPVLYSKVTPYLSWLEKIVWSPENK